MVSPSIKRALFVLLSAGAFLFTTSAFAQVNLPPTWVRQNSPTVNAEVAVDMAQDTVGNTILVGSATKEGNRDFSIVKIDRNGVVLWEAHYDGPDKNADDARAVTVDKEGNIYVTGRSTEAADNTFRAATVKLSPQGQPLWAVRYNGSGAGSDIGEDVIVGKDGFVYVCATSAGLNAGVSSNDIVLLKYDASSGDQIFIRRYNSPGDGIETAFSLAQDSKENITIFGNSPRNGLGGMFLIQYTPAGVKRWEAALEFNIAVSGRQMAFGPDDSIIINGSYLSVFDWRFVTVKYNSEGQQQWFRTFAQYPPAESYGIAVDKNGDIFVAATTTVPNSPNIQKQITLVKYNKDGAPPLWVQNYVPAGKNNLTVGVTLDKQGNPYVLARVQPVADNAELATMVLKYSTSGQLLWRSSYVANTPRRIAVDNDGSVFVCTNSINNGVSDDMVAMKISPYYPLDAGIGGDGKLRLLTRRSDGLSAQLRLINPMTSSVERLNTIPSPKDSNPQALAVASDNRTFLLWQRADGQFQIWSYTPDLSQVIARLTLGPIGGRRPVDLTVGRDGWVRVSLRSTDPATRHRLFLWTIDPNLAGVSESGPFDPPTASQQLALSIGRDNLPRVYWQTTSAGLGKESIWSFSSSGQSVLNRSSFGPLSGLVSADMAMGFDNKARVLLRSTNGGSAMLYRMALLPTVTEKQFVLSPPVLDAVPLKVTASLENRDMYVLWQFADGRTLLRYVDPSTGAIPNQIFLWTY